MDKVADRTKGLRSSVAKFTKIGAAGFLAVAGAAAILGGALLKIVNANSKVIDKIAKFSDEIGSTTEQLAGYRLGAELTGVSTESLDKGLQRLVRRLGEAKQGYGEGIKGFEALGIAADEISTLDTDTALRRVADAIKNTEDPAKKAATAYALFGRQGQELLTFLNQGAEGIDGFVAEAERLGGTFSREDAAKVEAYNDSVTKLKTFLTGIGQTLTIQVVPFLTAFVDKLTNAGAEGIDAGKIISKAFGFIGEAIAYVADLIELVKAGFFGLQGIVTKGIEELIVGPVASLVSAVDAVLEAVGAEPTGAAEFLNTFKDELGQAADDAFKKADEAFRRFGTGAAGKEVKQKFADIQAAADAAAAEIAKAAAAQREQQAAADAFIAQAEAYEKAQQDIASIIADTEKALFEFGKTQDEITRARLAELNATDEQIAAYQRAANELSRLEAAQEAREAAAKAAQKAEEERSKRIDDLRGERDDLLGEVAERANKAVEVRFADAISRDSAESGRLAQLRAAEERRFREQVKAERDQLATLNRQLTALETIAANTGGNNGGGVTLVGID